MDEYVIDGRYKALRDEMRDLHDEVDKLRKKKANGADVEEIAKKVSDIESEMRNKFGSLQSQNGEMKNLLDTLITKVDALNGKLSHQEKQVNELGENSKVSALQRIPVWCWALMAVGGFAIAQVGLEQWVKFKGAVP